MRRNPENFLRVIATLALLLSAFGLRPSAFASASAEAQPTARFEISGLGLLKNRELRQRMDAFVNPGKVAHLSDDAAENAAFVLVSELEADGYLHPKIKGTVTRLDGTSSTFAFDEKLDTDFPRQPGTNIVAFDVERGTRFYIAEVRIDGLATIPGKTAAGFFQPAFGWWNGKRANVFSEASIRRGRNALIDALLIRGYAQAKIEIASSPLPKPDGAMRLDIKVTEGPRWVLSSITLADPAKTDIDASALQKFVGEPWSEATRQDATVATRRAYYREGFPDVTARTTPTPSPAGPETQVAATVEVTPGPRVTIGQIRYQGNDRTRLGPINRRVRLQTGDPLDPTAIERARLRLGRLAAFTGVDSETVPVNDTTRDIVFTFTEADPWDASLLAGYGSYEQFRGGIETRRTNLWGRAHQDRLFLVQSMKSTRGDYTYTVPDLFGETIDGSARIFGLRREEVAFRREEYGGTVQLRKRVLGPRGPELTGGYTYETLQDKNNTLGDQLTPNSDTVATSLNLGIDFDRRDQAISPHDGYRLYVQTEYASKNFGGEVDYQRIEWGASWHTPLSTDRWLHLGLTQTAVFTFGADPYVPPPVNKLYYPGGDNSLRGYGEGKASPRDTDGAFLGAKTYTLANIELEQALTQQWSVVLFYGWLTEAARIGDYPGDTDLSSLGLGLRYRTIVGPVRLEYARNLNPRALDPGGAWHLSIGYPF